MGERVRGIAVRGGLVVVAVTPLESGAAGATAGALGCAMASAGPSDAAARGSIDDPAEGASMRVANWGAANGSVAAASSVVVEDGRATGDAAASRVERADAMLDDATS